MRRSLASLRLMPSTRPPSRALATAASRTVPPLSMQVTTLPNGVRVATDPTPGHFVAAGVYLDAGSRFEGPSTRGASHFVDRLGFKSTKNRSSEQMTKEIEALGQQFMSASSRDTIMYQASTYTQSLPAVLSILSDSVLNPLITREEIDAEREAAAWEIQEIKEKPALILPELLHATAYRDNTLGLDTLCPEDRLASMSPDIVKEYLATWYRPERTVVAASGVPHEDFVELVDRYFGSMKVETPSTINPSLLQPTTPSRLSNASRAFLNKYLSTSASAAAQVSDASETPSSSTESFETLANTKAVYTGGEHYIEKPKEEFTHFYVGFESPSVKDEDIYTVATLGVLLGGGHSFSAGGPGKGMYSRLYTHVLNQYHSVDYCQSFHHTYADSGLFGIALSCEPHYAREAAWLLATQIDSVTRPVRGGVSELDLARAKNQLKSSLAMALESRLVQVEDLGRQVLVYGRKYTMDDMAKRIDAVTLKDLYRVASRIFRPSTSSILSDRQKSGKPTIVVQGQLGNVPDVADVLRKRGFGEAAQF